MNFTLLDGIISGLERTTQVSGGGNTTTSTMHVAIFKLGEDRVLLETESPAMIADGDHVKLAGIRGQGEFRAAACRNMTTGWVSPCKSQGCAKSVLIGFGLVSLALTFIFPSFVLMLLVCMVSLFFVLRGESRMKSAQALVNR